MQFAPTNVEPSPTSKVTVTFSGLLLIKPGADNTLEAGIHKLSSDHFFQVMLIVNKPNLPPKVIRLFQGPIFSDFEMVVNPAGDGVQKFVADQFDPENAATSEKDFRWTFNFATLQGHEEVDFNEGARPMAKLNAGVLYAANLIQKGLGLSLRQGFESYPLGQFSIDLAAAIDLPKGTTMTLMWREWGEQRTVTLPNASDPDDTTYTVALVNDPPDYADPQVNQDASNHDEMIEYYKVLQIGGAPVPPGVECHIEVAPGHRSDEIPCLIGVMEPPGAH
jgi:hypothetical protein